jgi:hypothetical protein
MTGSGPVALLGRASYAMIVAPSLAFGNEIHWVETAGSSGATERGLVDGGADHRTLGLVVFL